MTAPGRGFEQGEIEPESQLAEPAPESAPTKNRTVLVIDDLPYLLDLASIFLGRTVRVETALGGSAGLAAAARLRPDLVLCDDRMPEIDGLDVCRAVRADPDLADTPFVMLLSDPTAAARGAAIRAGAHDVLAKPLERLTLVEAVTHFLTYRPIRGLPRIDTDVPVTLTTHQTEGPGRVRNLSRGGAFVETQVPMVCADEIGLQFQLPGSATTLQSSAQVIWRRHDYEARPDSEGVGLRFVEIDGASARALDDFVYEHQTPLEGATR